MRLRAAARGRRLLGATSVLAGTGLALLATGAIELALLAVSASLASGAISLRRRLSVVERLAHLDDLTGLGNRRVFRRDLERAVAEATAARPIALVLLDLDGFKGYNDAHGHPAGDALLRRLAERLATAVAGVGAAYRLGGDELCVLLRCPRADVPRYVAAAAAALCESRQSLRVTSSAGSVLLPDEADDAETALRLADERMYARKRHRRGRRHDDQGLELGSPLTGDARA